MAVSQEYRDFIAESLAPLGRVTLRRMFSGAGVFQGDLMFGLVTDDTLYLKVDETTRGDFEAAGCRQFTYRARGRDNPLAFWQVPDTLLDDPDELCRWARLAVDVAFRARAKAMPKGRAKAAAIRPKVKAKAKARLKPKAKAKPARGK
jgi:DNA transformation protein